MILGRKLWEEDFALFPQKITKDIGNLPKLFSEEQIKNITLIVVKTNTDTLYSLFTNVTYLFSWEWDGWTRSVSD